MLQNNGLDVIEVARKPIPFIKARGNHIERLIVRFFTYLEMLFGREFELLVVARKREPDI